MDRSRTSLTVAVAAALLVPSAGAAASPARPGAAVTGGSTTPTVEVVASGLDHPRGLVAGPFGTVIVTESGREGQEPCLPPSPGTANKPACVSSTGAVTLAWRGHTVRLADGLASIGAEDGTAASGPHDIALTRHGALIAFGYANNPDGRDGLGEAAHPLGQLVSLGLDGTQRNVGDLAAYEGSENPDGLPGFAGHWSNPYSVVVDGADTLVADSGGNTVLRVRPDGTVTTEALFPTREMPAPPPLGLPPGATVPMQSVPTGMVRGPDGAVYVGELTGFPFTAGEARVHRLVPGQEPEVAATGFTNIIDVGFDAQGRLLVLEIFTNGIPSGDPTGALKRVEADGTVTTLLTDGLVSPTAMAVGPDGAVYVSNNGTTVGGGEVLRISVPS